MVLLEYDLNDYTDDQINEFKKYVNSDKKIISKQTALAHYQAKSYLSSYNNVHVSDIKFNYINGKPFYEKGPYFNIAHSRNIVIIVFDDSPIGVDVEKIRPIKQNMLSKIATNAEKENINYDTYDIDFLKIWTAKEAYFKYIGTGITDLKSITKQEIYSNYDVQVTVNDKYVLTIVKGR